MKELLGPSEWARLNGALPQQTDIPAFVGGLVVGAGKGAIDTVVEDIQLARDCVGGILKFYKLVYDPDVWAPMLRTWLDKTVPLPRSWMSSAGTIQTFMRRLARFRS